MSTRRLTRILCATLVVFALLSAQPVRAGTITVTNTSDSGPGSLRAAINQANSNPGPDTIEFDIPPCMGGICYIYPTSALPNLTDNGTTIDGYTQPGAAPATASTPATIVIQVDGFFVPSLTNGLTITSANNLIRGLAITQFKWNGIAAGTATGNSNVISGNYIGLHADGTTDAGNGSNGVYLTQSGQNNLVGGDTPAERNIISGNGWGGVGIYGGGTNGNTVSGNYIGTDETGASTLPNDLYGVRIYGGAQDNTIGGSTPAERNIISGNAEDGVRILGANTTGNTVAGNFIGTDASGTSQLKNGLRGVRIDDAGQNTIGPDNLISGNDRDGVMIINANATGNVVLDNYIGTNQAGTVALENDGNGVYIVDAQNNTVGPGNVISGNDGKGVWIDDSDGNTVTGNYIGVGANGTSGLGNTSSGVFIGDGSLNNLIGGNSPTERNVISGNGGDGIELGDATTADNTISGNYIGLAANGSTTLGNSDGITIGTGVHDITIGGLTAGERNVISGNNGDGIVVYGTGTTGILIQGNYIGTNATGASDRGNSADGILVWSGAYTNTVGGDLPGARNLISGNGNNGVRISGVGTTHNRVSGNYIGTDASGSAAIGNDHAGVEINFSAQDNLVGGMSSSERNVISGNEYGVLIQDTSTTRNYVSNNYIGTAANRRDALGNQRDGVHVSFGAESNAIGPGNTIAHNGFDGVRIDTPTAFNILVLENSIFNNFDLGIDLTNGANHTIQPPVIVSSTEMPFSVSGTACATCLVEVYCSRDTDGEGEILLGQTGADAGGNFTLDLNWAYYPHLTATATIHGDGTSEFSAVYTAQVPDILFLPVIQREP